AGHVFSALALRPWNAPDVATFYVCRRADALPQPRLVVQRDPDCMHLVDEILQGPQPRLTHLVDDRRLPQSGSISQAWIGQDLFAHLTIATTSQCDHFGPARRDSAAGLGGFTRKTGQHVIEAVDQDLDRIIGGTVTGLVCLIGP